MNVKYIAGDLNKRMDHLFYRARIKAWSLTNARACQDRRYELTEMVNIANEYSRVVGKELEVRVRR